MASLRYNILLRPEPEGGYTAFVPALPGCISFGKTVEDARAMASDAIEGYIASLRKAGEHIPTDEKSFLTTVEVRRARTKRARTHA